MYSSYEEEGQNMINIADMQESFVVALVTKLMQPEYEN